MEFGWVFVGDAWTFSEMGFFQSSSGNSIIWQQSHRYICIIYHKLYQHRPQIAKNQFCVINVKNNVTSAKVQGSFSGCFFWMPLLCRVSWAPRNGTDVTPAPNHSTLQWHPTMGPSNGTMSTAPCNSTGATSNLPKWFVALPHYWK